MQMEERRAECIAHEGRIDDIQAEIHKHGGWFKIMGGGLGILISLFMFFGARLDAKLSSIQDALTKAAIEASSYNQRLIQCEKKLDTIETRHDELDRTYRQVRK
jgi:hypothetical protein